MKTIWKYKIRIEDHNAVDMPVGSIFRALEQQSNRGDSGYIVVPNGLYCTLWYEVPDTDAKKETRIFGIFETGHPQPDEPMTYLGTMIIGHLGLVFHIYEMKE